ncbi:MAG: tetratricopeptide repeat protein [Roseimicrobium sp.]
MNSRSITHLCIASLFALAFLWVLGSWKQWSEEGAVVNQLFSVMLLAVSFGFFVVLVVLPRFGDAVGTALLSSGEEISEDAGRKAAAMMARGDYEGALEEYQKQLKETPDDPHPISEMAKICAEKLRDPERALAALQEHLESHDWTEENAAFLMFRMADVHLTRNAFDGAKDILEQIAGNFPGTRHSANARSKIEALEQAEFRHLQEQRLKANASA